MSLIIAKLDPTVLLVFGVICCALSGLLLFGRKLRFLPFSTLLIAAIAVPVAVCHFALDMPVRFPLVLPILAGTSLLILLMRSAVVTGAVVRSANRISNPAFFGATLLAAGICLVGFAAVGADPDSDDLDDILKEVDGDGAREYVTVEGYHATTDRGANIPLLQITNSKADALARTDKRIADQSVHRLSLIRVTEPTSQTNCHGWVFTGGLCWVSNDSVDVILQDNDYQQVDLPTAKDLAIYRDEQGQIVHTAIVRAVWPEGRILVESKWGALGVFIHFVEHSVYGSHWSFHHTSRPTHVLLGLPLPSDSSPGLNARGS